MEMAQVDLAVTEGQLLAKVLYYTLVGFAYLVGSFPFVAVSEQPPKSSRKMNTMKKKNKPLQGLKKIPMHTKKLAITCFSSLKMIQSEALRRYQFEGCQPEKHAFFNIKRKYPIFSGAWVEK